MATTSMAANGAARQSAGYQMMLVGLLALNFGIVFFDRNSLNFLMPFVQPELGLTNTQVGVLASVLSGTWSVAALLMGWLSDTLGKRKVLLIASTLLFSACSFLTGIAGTFVMLIAARALMGVAEGGVMPISHALIADEVDPERRGLAQGVGQNFGSNLLGSFVAPVALVAFATWFGWRHAFFLAGAPGLISALLILWLVKEPKLTPKKAQQAAGPRYTAMDGLKERNVLLCVLLSVLLVAYLVTCWAFMPLYLDQVLHVSKDTNGWLMGTLGISATIGSFAVPGLSDRIGRRPVMIAAPFLSLLLPLGVLYLGSGSLPLLFVIFFVGWCVNGIFPLFMATVPSESVDPHNAALVMGLSMGAGEALGGVFGPMISGWIADAHGLTAPLWIMTGLAFVSGFVAMGLRETAPSKRRG